VRDSPSPAEWHKLYHSPLCRASAGTLHASTFACMLTVYWMARSTQLETILVVFAGLDRAVIGLRGSQAPHRDLPFSLQIDARKQEKTIIPRSALVMGAIVVMAQHGRHRLPSCACLVAHSLETPQPRLKILQLTVVYLHGVIAAALPAQLSARLHFASQPAGDDCTEFDVGFRSRSSLLSPCCTPETLCHCFKHNPVLVVQRACWRDRKEGPRATQDLALAYREWASTVPEICPAQSDLRQPLRSAYKFCAAHLYIYHRGFTEGPTIAARLGDSSDRRHYRGKRRHETPAHSSTFATFCPPTPQQNYDHHGPEISGCPRRYQPVTVAALCGCKPLVIEADEVLRFR
jgi:hypothetical protein